MAPWGAPTNIGAIDEISYPLLLQNNGLQSILLTYLNFSQNSLNISWC